MGQILGYLYNGNKSYDIKEITIVENEDKCHAVIERLRRETNTLFPVLGMDCEWVPDKGRGERHPVALLQLATVNGFCALFRLSHMTSVPEPLKNILLDENILKVGVGIQNDVNRLKINVRSWVDIRHLEFLVRTYPKKESVEDPLNGTEIKLGLAHLAKRILGVQLDKDGGVRFGKWDSEQLTDEQIKYAAWDAFSAVLICHELTHQEEAIQAYSVAAPVDFLRNVLEVRYKFGDKVTYRSSQDRVSARNKGASISKRNYHLSIPCRKMPMYDNIFLLAPDGEILCTCDRKRAMWYVEKGIGEMIEEKSSDMIGEDADGNYKTCLKVQLKFEPNRRAIDESEKYYCLVKSNQCVVCGKEDSYLRKHIVPHEYRKYFPVWMKSHQSHDVLLLCIDCHMRSNCLDLNLRQKLSQDCDAPLTVAKAVEVQDAQVVKKVQSAAKALSRQSSNIPEERRKELESIVMKYFSSETEIGVPETVTPDMLNRAMELMLRVTNEAYVPHGLKVVEHFQKTVGEEDGIRDLEVLWRQHFINEMRPKYLPALWSTHHFRMSPSEKEQEKIQSREIESPDS